MNAVYENSKVQTTEKQINRQINSTGRPEK